MGVSRATRLHRLFSGAAWVVPLSFFPTLARAAFLAYLIVFLNGKFRLAVDDIGLFVGSFILLSSVSSLFFGALLDRWRLRTLMVTSALVQSMLYMGIFSVDSLLLVFIFCLVLNLAYLSLETAVRMCIAQLFSARDAGSVLSIKYSLTSLAYAVGPLIGLWLNRQAISPLLFCSVVTLGFTLVAAIPLDLAAVRNFTAAPHVGLRRVLAIMAGDRRLLLFTLASVFLAGVFGQFTLYLGQYLMTRHDPARMYEIINVVFVTNALVSVGLQYVIGSRVCIERMRSWVIACVLMFMIGVIGFACSNSLIAWVLFTAVFTVGEIIVQPLEFMYLTRIAPVEMAGAYYSSQNLAYIGASLTPVVCGFILADLNPIYFLLYLFMLLLSAGALLYRAAADLPHGVR